MNKCEYNVHRCSGEAVEQVTAFETSQIPRLSMRLCNEDAAQWCSVLEKRHREFERISLITGKSLRHKVEGFQRTARVGRGVSKK